MDRIKAVLEKIKDFWNKFNKKQKTVFISVSAAIAGAIIIMAIVLNRDTSVVIRNCTSESEAVEVRGILTDAGINCTVDRNNVIRVSNDDYVEAKLTLGSNNISSDGYSLEDAVNGSFTTTSTDSKNKYKAYLESKFARDLESIEGIKKARVTIDFKDTDSTIFSSDEDASITAILTLTHELDEDQCESIGLLLATNVGSADSSKSDEATNNNVTVLDSTGRLLYHGGRDSSYASGKANLKVKQQLEQAIIANAKSVFLANDYYTDLAVAPNLKVNFDDVEVVSKKYNIPDGSEEGLKSHSYNVTSSGSFTDASGAAGTESNDEDTTYMIQNGDGTSSEYTVSDIDWLQDETITTTSQASGQVDFDNSTIALVATKVNQIYEEDAREQGLLGDLTWEQYKAANSDPVQIDVDDTWIDLVSKATGIPTANISVMAYTRNAFYDTQKSARSPFFIIQIILAVLIAALLIFIIIRSMKPVTVAETEPELSVEDMLATTKEQQPTVADIDLQDKSATRVAIEKFVDENPEAVAALLRNWLNDDWG